MQRTLSLIDLQKIRRNALRIKTLAAGKKFYAVVKADGYGHGGEEVARAIEDIADGFCVAIIEEGISLRIAGITKEILVLTPPLDSFDISRSKEYNLSVTVNSENTAKLIKDLPCHIKVNTGMNRHGCNLADLEDILKVLEKDKIRGVYSHFFAPENDRETKAQLFLFEWAEKIVKKYSPQAIAHISASGGLLKGILKDGVRCGILLYGYTPSGFENIGFEKALKVYARLTQITRYIGGGVGYGISPKNFSTLYTYRLGYADGFSRNIPLGVNNLCMDSFIAEGGKELECILSDAEEYAAKAGTIPYEVLVNATRRSERVYIR